MPLTANALQSRLWDAANTLRGSAVDRTDWKGYIREYYKPQPMRSLEEIRADILALESETEGLLEEVIGGKH